MPDLSDIDSLWNYSDNAGSEARFREALSRAESGAEPAYVAELLTQLARSIGRQGRFDEARHILARAESILLPTMPRARVRLLLERGRIFNSSGDPSAAIPFFVDAFHLAMAEKLNRLAVDAVHMIAIAEQDPVQQIEWNLKGVALANDTGERKWLYALYNNLGEAYASHGDFANALATFQKLVALDIEQNKEPDLMAQKDVAKMLRLLGRFDDAIAMLVPIVNKLDADAKPDGWIEDELGESLHASGRHDEAKVHFARAYELLKSDPWFTQHEPAKLERLRQLSS